MSRYWQGTMLLNFGYCTRCQILSVVVQGTGHFSNIFIDYLTPHIYDPSWFKLWRPELGTTKKCSPFEHCKYSILVNAQKAQVFLCKVCYCYTELIIIRLFVKISLWWLDFCLPSEVKQLLTWSIFEDWILSPGHLLCLNEDIQLNITARRERFDQLFSHG